MLLCSLDILRRRDCNMMQPIGILVPNLRSCGETCAAAASRGGSGGSTLLSSVLPVVGKHMTQSAGPDTAATSCSCGQSTVYPNGFWAS